MANGVREISPEEWRERVLNRIRWASARRSELRSRTQAIIDEELRLEAYSNAALAELNALDHGGRS